MSTTPQSVVGLAGATDIRGAMEFTCALAGGGQVWCWGDPSSGGLGNGVFTGMAAPPAAVSGLAGAVAISVGESHACAIMADQTVQCWGANTTGELGDGTLSVFSTPTPVLGLSGAVSVACGSFHTCALLDDGSVRCWGQNVDAELGNGPPSSDLATMPVPVAGLGGVTTLAAGSTHTCALLDNGTVRCWGNAILGQSGTATPANAFTIDVPTTVAGVAGATSVVAGDNFTCALVTGGSVKCWGENTSGQLGDGSKPNDMNNPVPVTVVEGR
jgi:alpha-tubulin suppressor-like RCC1 family protein